MHKLIASLIIAAACFLPAVSSGQALTDPEAIMLDTQFSQSMEIFQKRIEQITSDLEAEFSALVLSMEEGRADRTELNASAEELLSRLSSVLGCLRALNEIRTPVRLEGDPGYHKHRHGVHRDDGHVEPRSFDR